MLFIYLWLHYTTYIIFREQSSIGWSGTEQCVTGEFGLAGEVSERLRSDPNRLSFDAVYRIRGEGHGSKCAQNKKLSIKNRLTA